MKRRFTLREKVAYHKSRDMHPKKHHLRFGSPKHTYSVGYVDGYENELNNARSYKKYGKKSLFSYLKGYNRGKRARRR